MSPEMSAVDWLPAIRRAFVFFLVVFTLFRPTGVGAIDTVSVGPFNVKFYGVGESDGSATGGQNWTTPQKADVAAAIKFWSDRIYNKPGRPINLHLFWTDFGNPYVLGGSISVSSGDGINSWTYAEHVWKDGVNYSGPWAGWDSHIQLDITAASAPGGWNFGAGSPGAYQIDFRSILTHEIGHGLGFVDTYDPSDDTWGNTWGRATSPFLFAGYRGISAWDNRLVDSLGNRPLNSGTGTPSNFNQTDNPIYFNGPRATAYHGGLVPIYAPTSFESGSSLAHLDGATFPSALMKPAIATGQFVRQPTTLEWEMMRDMGWIVIKEWTGQAGSLNWASNNNWDQVSFGLPDQTSHARFTNTGLAADNTIDLSGDRAFHSLGIDSTTNFTIGGASGTITLSGGAIDRLPTSAGTQTVARSVALGSSAIWDINGAGELNVASAIGGSFSFQKKGAGKLHLSGSDANTFGPTTVSAGTLVVGKVAGVNALSGNVTVSGGTLQNNASNQISDTADLTVSGGVWNLNGQSERIDDLTFSSGTIHGGSLSLDSLTMSAGARLQVAIGGTAPGSGYDQLTIDGSALLNGTVEFALVNDFVPSAGQRFDFLSANNVQGSFATEQLPLLGGGLSFDLFYAQNLVGLYVDGCPGDFNHDRRVDGADYVIWRRTLGQTGTALAADANQNGVIDIGDYDLWRQNYGVLVQPFGSGSSSAVPEPATLLLLISTALGRICVVRHRTVKIV